MLTTESIFTEDNKSNFIVLSQDRGEIYVYINDHIPIVWNVPDSLKKNFQGNSLV